jgi:Fe-S cluster biogenesis protein NfuA
VSTDLPSIGERIEELLDVLHSSVDPRAWGRVEELVRLLTDLYGAGLVLAVELGGDELVARLAADEVGASLLALHGLHPDDLAARVERALASIAPGIRKGGGDLRLDSTPDGVVHVVLTTAGGCGSTGEALRQQVEQAVWGAAPDAAGVDVRVVVAATAAPTPIRLGPTRKVAVGGGS